MWAFIPFNLLPKLRALRDGQSVGAFDYFVDSSPKIADVKVGGKWRTYLFFGQGPGGTFYHTLDVTLEDMARHGVAELDQRQRRACLLRGRRPHPVEVELPAQHQLRSRRSATCTASCRRPRPRAVEKTVGETWSDPAIGQV